jgi:hypothetical protein
MVLVMYTIFSAPNKPDTKQTSIIEPAFQAVIDKNDNIDTAKAANDESSIVPAAVSVAHELSIGQASVPSYNTISSLPAAVKQGSDKLTDTDSLVVPWINSDFKAYMAYDMVTDSTAPQWKYREMAHTDENGLRRIGEDYLVAMGTYYSESVGARFRITLDSGSVFTVTVGDIKNPAHTDTYNMYTPVKDKSGNVICANVLEFIVDTDKLPPLALRLGTVSCLDGLEGNVKQIERLESLETDTENESPQTPV